MKKLLHWIACHNVLVVLLVFLIIAIIFREPLFGIKSSSSQQGAIEEPVASVSENTEKKQPEKTPSEKTLEQSEPSIVEPRAGSESLPQTINAETADDIQQREQYDFRPPDALPVEDVKNEDLLQQARKAYWNEQLDLAQKFYLAYIEQDPENPDGYGELGNLLSTLGELDEAAKMYQQAADLLIKQGKPEQAEPLLEVLESIRVIQTENE